MKIFLVDDNILNRSGMAALLERECDFEIIGEASGIDEAVKNIVCTKPEIVLLNAKIGVCSSLPIVRRVIQAACTAKFIVLDESYDEAYFKAAFQLGVNSYILKSILPDDLVHAIRQIGRGRKYIDPNVVEYALYKKDKYHQALTSREIEILAALREGHNENQIAEKLNIKQYTVKKHIASIVEKLNLKDKLEAVAYASSMEDAEYNMIFIKKGD